MLSFSFNSYRDHVTGSSDTMILATSTWKSSLKIHFFQKCLRNWSDFVGCFIFLFCSIFACYFFVVALFCFWSETYRQKNVSSKPAGRIAITWAKILWYGSYWQSDHNINKRVCAYCLVSLLDTMTTTQLYMHSESCHLQTQQHCTCIHCYIPYWHRDKNITVHSQMCHVTH